MRKQTLCILSIIFLAILLIGVSCSLRWLGEHDWQPPEVVSIEGPEWGSIWPYYIPVFKPLKEGEPMHLLLRDGDILFGDDFSFLYRGADGHAFSVSVDKTRAMIEGKTVSISLNKDEGWQWLERATPEDLTTLRLVRIGNEFDVQKLALFKRLSERNPNLGLWIENIDSWQKVAPLFDPVWLFLGDDSLRREDRELLANKKQIRTLFVKGGQDLAFLSQITGLETLIVGEWDPVIAGPFHEDLQNLKRLILVEPKSTGLALLGRQPNIEELSLVVSESLEHLSWLTHFPNLRILRLYGCEKVSDLTPLRHLKKLRWLGLPSNTTQKQLEEIVQEQKGLVVLELFGLEKVTDLTPLKDLPYLKYLMAVTPNARPDPLFEMKNLKWLAFGSGKKKSEGEEIALELQKALPQTAVVRTGFVCLGSGWILLLAPTCLLAWWVKGRPRSAAQRNVVRYV